MKHLYIIISLVILIEIAIITTICLTTKENWWGWLVKAARYPNCPHGTSGKKITDAYCNDWYVSCCEYSNGKIDKNNCSTTGWSTDYFGHRKRRSLSKHFKGRYGGPWPHQSCSDRKKSCRNLRGLDIETRIKNKKNKPGIHSEPVCKGVVLR